MNDKISVIIPVYNSETFLPRCLNSILRQTYNNIEIICVDDNSTDNSLEVLKKFAKIHPNITVLENDTNRGQGVCKNLALKEASGVYISFIDSDDYISSDFYERMVDVMHNSNADIVMSDLCIESAKKHKFNSTVKTVGSWESFYDKLSVINNGSCCNKLFRAEIIRKNGIKFPQGVFFEDNEFLLKALFCSGKFEVISHGSYFYCHNPKSTTKGEEYYSLLKNSASQVYKNILEFFSSKNLTDRECQKLHKFCTISFCLKFIEDKSFELPHGVDRKALVRYAKSKRKLCSINEVQSGEVILDILFIRIKFRKKRRTLSPLLFSVIIPTMQKNKTVLGMLLDELVADECVGEIIVINNSATEFEYPSDKINVITPGENIFVNPAWNLGVKIAKYDYIGILNDDLILPKNFLASIRSFVMGTKKLGYVGLRQIPKSEAKDCRDYPTDLRLRFKEIWKRPLCWGSAFFFLKSNYFVIPEEMKVWCGDDFLFYKSLDKGLSNYAVSNSNIKHLHSLTSDLGEFDEIKFQDQLFYKKINPEYCLLPAEKKSFIKRLLFKMFGKKQA